MKSLQERVARCIREHKLFRPGQRLLVAVSGGVDSMVLLDLLQRMAPENSWRLTVAHFNHRLRGRSSDADERLVRQTASRLGLPFVRAGADVSAFARAGKLSIEMAGRQLRHAFLARAARESGSKTIALAHHADDQVELFFVRLLRGGSGEGLAGMDWTSPSPADPRIALARPLLAVPKADLRAWARQRKIAFREDASNAVPDKLRNRIRQQLIPLLARRYQPALAKVILRQMEILRAEAEHVGRAAESWLKSKSPSACAGLPLAVQRRALALQLVGLGLVPEFDLIERLRLAVQRSVAVSPERELWRDAQGRLHAQAVGASEFKSARMPVVLKAPAGQAQFDGLTVCWRVLSGRGRRKPRPAQGRESFDADKVGRSIVLRHWRPGDRFQPSGMRAPVKLQDLFMNLKIPRARRHELVIATTDGGEIWWVEGLRIAEPFKLSQSSMRRLSWQWRR